jgi:hypothetical protein
MVPAMKLRLAAAVLTTVALAVVGAAPASAQADLNAQVTAASDWNGDGTADLAALTTDGKLYVYLNAGVGKFAKTPRLVATGLRGFNWVQIAGDVDEDGQVDILARSGTGALLLLRGAGGGALAGVTTIAGNWSSYEEILPIDLDRDGKVDLLALDRNGTDPLIGNSLRLYIGEAGAAFRASYFTPLGPAQYDSLSAWGDADRDGYQEIVARDRATGRVYALETRGTISSVFQQTKSQHRLIGEGFNIFTAIHSGGSHNDDTNPDLLVRDSRGNLVMYRGYQGGRITAPYLIGTGFGSLTFG